MYKKTFLILNFPGQTILENIPKCTSIDLNMAELYSESMSRQIINKCK